MSQSLISTGFGFIVDLTSFLHITPCCLKFMGYGQQYSLEKPAEKANRKKDTVKISYFVTTTYKF